MRKLTLIVILILTLTMSACTNQDHNTCLFGEGETIQTPSMVHDGEWPMNQYTENLPVPNGTVSLVLLDEEKGYCSITLDDVDETEYQDYMGKLKDEGFSVVNEVSEEIEGESYVSIGTILSDDTKGISISYIPGNLGIYISFWT